MSPDAVRPDRRALRRGRALAILLVIAGLAVVLAANAHLIWVAFTNQPECVAAPDTGSGAHYAPARSSC